VQVLDRSLDHRLARVQRLEYAPTGVLWALLNDGVARVQFSVTHLKFRAPPRQRTRLRQTAAA